MPGPDAGVARRPSKEQRSGARGRRRDASPRKATAIDRHVGNRLRKLRLIHGVSLEALAGMVDVAPQQIQKYEVGETRLSASRIFELSKIFAVPVTWFYDELDAATSAEMYARIRQCRTAEDSNEAQDLLVSYYAQLTPEMRGRLIDFARLLSQVVGAQGK